MRTLVLSLALLLPATTFAQDAPPAQPPAEAPAEAPAESALQAAAPATVLSHEVTVVIDGSRRARTTVRWKIRVDDPAACAAGLVAPRGLDGASDGAASVLEDTLLVGDAAAGDVLELEATTTDAYRGSHSGAFLTAPDLPVEHARFEVRAPYSAPLHVWHDAAGVPDISAKGIRSASVEWSHVPADRPAEVVWSTWADWMDAGTEISALVDEKLTDRNGLGREMASGRTGLHVAEAAERVFAAIELDPHGTANWVDAVPATDTLEARRGSPVDRGVVLLSLLRLAGYDAEPGYYRPASARGSFPVTVPAPAMLGRPLIVVHRDDRDVFIDPAGDYVRVPQVPADLIGGVSWVPGDLPTPWVGGATVDGTVTVNGSLTVKGDGSATWSAEITASGTAEQRLRELLGPLDEEERTEALRQRVLEGRPELGRFIARATGISKARAKLKITLSGYDAELLAPVGAGLGGEVPALIAPALAAWLAPNIRVREVLSIQVPQAVEIVASGAGQSSYHEAALVTRQAKRVGARLNLVTEVERPYRRSTNALDIAADRVLAEEAGHGPQLLAHAAANKASIDLLHQTDLPEVDKLVIESVLWWRQRVPGKTAKPLKTGVVDHGGRATADALERYGATQRHLWQVLYHQAVKQGDAVDRLDVLVAAARSGHRDIAWEAAAELAADEDVDPKYRAEAWVDCIALQPEAAPHPDADPDGHARWAEPAELLERAAALGGAGDPRVAYERGRLAARAGDWQGVLTALEAVDAGSRSAAVQALIARAHAETGAPAREVLDQVASTLAAAPHDPAVLESAAAIATRVGEYTTAARHALTAARIQPDEPERWDTLVQASLTAGDLSTAGIAARNASDLRPHDPARAETLALVSAMLHDDEGWTVARTRNPNAMPSLATSRPSIQKLMELAPANALLAVLQYHDAAVVDDPVLLGIRAQMRLDAGLLDPATRDGVLLASRFDQADGIALAFAASAGRMYSSTWPDRLRRASEQSVAARATRMEISLLLGNADPTSDARKLEGDPRAELITRLRSDPKGLAAEVEGWPVDAKSPPLSVPGYRPNYRLGAAPGVTAISDAETGVALLRTVDNPALPPPLNQLYTPSEQALAEVPGGGLVVRLDGGPVPLFHASVAEPGDPPTRLHAVAFSVEAAARALAEAHE